MAPGQGPGLYKREKETCKNPVKERKGLKQSIKKHWGTIYCNTILAKPMLKRYMEVKSAKVNTGKRNPNCSMVNAIKNNNPKVLKRPNKGRKHNGNTFKNRDNKIKRLALLSKHFSK